MNKILFVINPISGDKDKTEYIKQIDEWAEGLELSIEKWETTGEADEEKLNQCIEAFVPDTVVAVGGDGTVMLCAKVLIDKGISLGILPAGSANGMATDIGFPEVLPDALDLILNGRTIAADMLLFNGKDYGLHISDVGLNAGLVKEFEEGERRGFLGYAKGVTSQLLNLEKFEATLKIGDKTVVEEGHMVAFANARRYGTGAVLNTIGKLDDGIFEVYVLRSLSIPGLAGQFFEHIDDAASYCEVYQASKVKVTLNEPRFFQIDGELMGETKEVSVEVVPGCLKLIVGDDY
ncbi:diacylglycerol kinase family protein [Roseivirga sp. UBA1976]|uniref:diacylglycerol/lipid kinase family protein n=1 Tax=Roseivirga sp. UBA1976 TaxID=1947386 RepID=UPI00257DC0CA|nr:diacylglycerol kinase family protein [Roseivirga sp. UBA1976]|tara:strand:+ start:162 stop:1037 length:876 start_codon:yes stop_codon:yes gene_type:complete